MTFRDAFFKVKRWPHIRAVPFFAASFLVLRFVATHAYQPDPKTWKSFDPGIYAGDEPHYLVMITSLLADGDLSLGNNYASGMAGGSDAGFGFRKVKLDHHTLIRNLRTGETALWEEIFNYHRPNDSSVGYERTSGRFPDFAPDNPNYGESPKHPLPFPLVVAGLLKLCGTPADRIERRAVYAMVFFGWLAGILLYGCALQAGLSRGESFGATALLYFSSSWLVYSREVFPATFMGVLLIGALWAFLSRRIVIAALLVAVAAIQSEGFLLILPAWALILHFEKERAPAWRFAAIGGALVAAMILLNHVLIGRGSNRSMDLDLNPLMFWRTYLKPITGLWLFVPWTIAALACLIAKPRDMTPLTKAMAAGILPVAAVYMVLPYTGEICYGPRYWIPFLPWLALAFGFGFKSAGREMKATLILLVCISTVIAVTSAVLPASAIWSRPPWHALQVLFPGY